MGSKPPKDIVNIMPEIVAHDNIQAALLQVYRNKGCAGLDGITPRKFYETFDVEAEKDLVNQLMSGKYKPQRLMRAYIPKENTPGEYRLLSIPVIKDRVVQQAIAQVLYKYYDIEFSDNSFAYRKNIGCHQALFKTLQYLYQGKKYVVNIDIRKFFDNVSHTTLMRILKWRIGDQLLLQTIYKLLRVSSKERRSKQIFVTEKGIPQGGGLSPLLANIVLNEFDHYLEMYGFSFVRYADDCIILCSSLYEAEYIYEKVSNFLELKLNLEVNHRKSSISLIDDIKYLGYNFADYYGTYYLVISPDKYNGLKQKIEYAINTYFRKAELNVFINKVNDILRGWVNYYYLAYDIKQVALEFDIWFKEEITNINVIYNYLYVLDKTNQMLVPKWGCEPFGAYIVPQEYYYEDLIENGYVVLSEHLARIIHKIFE